MKSPAYAVILILCSLSCNAQIYKTTDKDGNVSYTDAPSDGVKREQIELEPVNTTPGLDLKAAIKKRLQVDSTDIEYKLTITSPAAGSHLMADQRDLVVTTDLEVIAQTTSIEPGASQAAADAARSNGKIEILLNGKIIPGDGEGNAIFKEIYRGQHTVEAQLRGLNGKVLSSSGTTTFWVHRPFIRRPK